MVNWKKRLLIQGVTIVNVVCFTDWVTVLVDLVPERAPGAKGTANKQDLAERLKLCFIQMRAGIYTGRMVPGSATGRHDTSGTHVIVGRQ